MREPAHCEVTLSPSRYLLFVTVLAYVLTGIAVLLLLPLAFGIALVALLAAYAAIYCRRHYSSTSPYRVRAIRFGAEGWSVQCSGEWKSARLLSPVFCHRHLLVLRLRCASEWWPRAVAVMGDSCNTDDFRRLRVLASHLPAQRLWASSR